MSQWMDFVKTAAKFANGRVLFERGDNPSRVAAAYNRLNPRRRISAKEIMAANPGVSERGYRAGSSYKMPAGIDAASGSSVSARRQASSSASSAAPVAQAGAVLRGRYPGRLNNPGNMEYRANNGWPGQVGRGGSRDRFAMYDTPTDGGTAAIGRWMQIARNQIARGQAPTPLSITEEYSGRAENDVDRHAQNIASNTGRSSTAPIDVNDTGRWVDLARGLFRSESGLRHSQWFTPGEYTNMVNTARSVEDERRREVEARRRRERQQ